MEYPKAQRSARDCIPAREPSSSANRDEARPELARTVAGYPGTDGPAEALPIQLTWLNWLRDNLQENLADPSWDKIKKEMEEGILNDLGGAKRWVEDTRKEIQAAETVLRLIQDALAQEAYHKTIYKP